MSGNGRIINVSNRLPVKIASGSKEMRYQLSEGGLATGLSAVFKNYDNLWIGWPGAVVDEAQQPSVLADLQAQKLHPVFLDQEEINDYYEGFCNETIWPLFHYFLNYSGFNPQFFERYKAVNEKFAAEIVRMARKDDTIWIHDYQLMLLPQMVRKLMPEVTIGFFLHIPFPAYPVFNALPWREEIIQGLMGANLIGFQTNDDVQHFKECASRMLELDFAGDEVVTETGRALAQAFPISIDYEQFANRAEDAAIECSEAAIHNLIGGNKMILSVDRLDYSKGITQRLNAYELFLQEHPEWHEKVTFIHLIVPSRDNVRNYKELKEEMDRLVTSINGKYATLAWQPIRHLYRSVTPELLTALYKRADVALVTPLRDGMNLVCKEYVASNVNRNGVLVLSEAAGAARELKDALLVNPNDLQELSGRIVQALEMQAPEKARRMTAMQRVVAQADILTWARSFVHRLMEHKQAARPVTARQLNAAELQKVEVKYCYSAQRLLLLDYDGTLMPFFDRPEDACPDDTLLHTLRTLTDDPNNKVVIISGRDHQTLEHWLGHLPLDLVAEHGAWYREGGSSWRRKKELDRNWKGSFRHLFDTYSKAASGTFIEEKPSSIAWHYRQCAPELGNRLAAELAIALEKNLEGTGLQLLRGNKVLELKLASINKGKAAARWLAKGKYDFMLAVGDDTTDEDMFQALPAAAVTVKVGSSRTAAHYFVQSHTDVRALLTTLYESSRQFNESMVLQLTG